METKTFYDLITDHVIEIPIIQREYAQGRRSERVTEIRNRFVEDFMNSIKNDEVMHLGFIYGKIEGKDKQHRKQINRDALNSILQAVKSYADTLELKIDPNIKEDVVTNDVQTELKFIPLDGQQRLTTLYLLHWYLHLKGANSPDNLWLNHFNYTSRKSTMDFLSVINQSKNIETIRGRIKSEIDLKSAIKESSFYLQKWNKDQSIVGMIEMLAAIEKEFNKQSELDLSKINIQNLEFKFDFMDLHALNQTDELYVKMNSRGKQLSNFEHFKSWLQNEYDKGRKNWYKNFWRNLDNKWLNFFWKKIDADFNRLDDSYFNFLKNIALMHTIASHPEIPLSSFQEIIGLVRNEKAYSPNKISYIPFQKFYVEWNEKKLDEKSGENKEETKTQFIFSEENLKFIENTFSTLMNIEANRSNYDFLNKVLCQPFIEKSITDFYFDKNEFTPSQPDAVFYYAFIALLNKYKDLKDQDNITEWLRINRNLIYNTNIQNPKNFYDSLQQINYLVNNSVDFETQIINNNIKNTFFDFSQFNEEVLKAELIESNIKWYDPIIKTENQSYFMGQIKFILDFSKDESDLYRIDEFLKYSEACSKLYSNDIRLSDSNLLQRALLCEGDYQPYYKSNLLFCNGSTGNLRIRNENWRLFFKSDKIIILKKIIDKFQDNKFSKKTLSDYIQSYISDSDLDLSNWKFLFLNYPQAISYSNQFSIRWYTENDIRLLNGPKITGYHSELRSYCFYLANKDSLADFEPFKDIEPFEKKNSDGHPGCRLSGFNYEGQGYCLDIRYSTQSDKNVFQLCFFHCLDDFERRNMDKNIASILECKKFTFDNNHNHYYRESDFNDTKAFIQNVCKELKSII